MKKFMVVFLLCILAVPGFIFAQSTPVVKSISSTSDTFVVDKDYTWNTYVTATYGTPEYAAQRLTCIAWKKAVDQATADGKAGKYDEVIKNSPLSRQKAWAALNKLRVLMGGTKAEDGTWSGYKTDAKTGKFNGTDAEYQICITLANSVKSYVSAAVEAGMNKDMNGLDCQAASKWADHYLDGILSEEDEQ